MGMEATRFLFGFNHDALKTATDGFTYADRIFQPPGRGNCLNSAVGLVVATRSTVLELVEGEPILPESVAAPGGAGSNSIYKPVYCAGCQASPVLFSRQ
jgi:hypothetical protein